MEDLFLEFRGLLVSIAERVEGVHPLVAHRVEFDFHFLDFGHLKIDKGEFVVKNVFVFDIHELDSMEILILGILVSWENKVQDGDQIHVFEVVVPAFLWLFLFHFQAATESGEFLLQCPGFGFRFGLAFLALFLDGYGGVVKAPVLKVDLLAVLHLHDEVGT